MDIISKNCAELGARDYNFSRIIKNIDGKITGIFIASAYTDITELREIINIFRDNLNGRGATISIYNDKSASNVLTDPYLRRQYRNLSTRIKTLVNRETNKVHVDDCGIFLVDMGKLFHSKVVYITSEIDNICIIGSINITKYGIKPEGNEELFIVKRLNLHEAEAIRLYFSWLGENSQNVHESEEIEYPNLRSFFLSGCIYIPTNKLNIFNYHLNLPAGLPQHISIHEFVDSKVSNTLNVLKMCKIDSVIDEEEQTATESWKSYCIQTGYGYWCPNSFIETVDGIIEGIVENEESRIVKKLEQITAEDFMPEAERVFQQISSNIGQYGLSWSVDQGNWERWYQKLVKRIFLEEQGKYTIKEDVLSFLISGVYKSNLPDLWYTENIVNDFETSFELSLENESQKKRKTKIGKTFAEAGVVDIATLKDAIKNRGLIFS